MFATKAMLLAALPADIIANGTHGTTCANRTIRAVLLEENKMQQHTPSPHFVDLALVSLAPGTKTLIIQNKN